MRFGIIGTGVVGTALTAKLTEAGYECAGVYTRSRASYERFCNYLNYDQLDLAELVPTVDAVFITTQDGMIRPVAEQLAAEGLGRPGQLWIHCSGSLSSQVLRVNQELPVRCLSVHPLQAFADVQSALGLLAGTHFGVEGEAEEEGEEIVRALGGIPHRLETAGKSLYHAGAVVVSNYMVVLAAMAVELFAQAGIEQGEALESLVPLMKGTIHNLSEVGLPRALTGPIARGDVEVIKGHLQQMPPDLAGIYRELGAKALTLGQEKWALKGGNYPDEVWAELTALLGEDKV